MKILVAVDSNWAIGYRGEMLFHLPKDLAYFREKTLHQVLVVGRSTLGAFPEGKALADRTTIVLSNYPGLEEGDMIVTSMENLPDVLDPYRKAGKEVYLIGGGTLYRQLLEYCTHAYVTHVKAASPLVDSYFPNLELEEHWEKIEESELIQEGDYAYSFVTYINHQPKPLEALREGVAEQ